MTNRFQRKLLLAFFSALAALAGSPAYAKLRVVTTLASFADLARTIGGDAVEVTSLTKGTQDPHFVDPRPSLVLSLNRADLLILNGVSLEIGWLPPLIAGARNAKIRMGGDGYLDASTAVQLQQIPATLDRSQGDIHPGGNPHYMLDPENGLKVAAAIAQRLSRLEPTQAVAIQQRYKQYATRFNAKIVEWKKQLAPVTGRGVVTYHRSWFYFIGFARLSDLVQLEDKPGIPPSPEHVVRVIALMKEKRAGLILLEPYYPKGVGEQIARETGAKLLVLPAEVEGTAGVDSYIGLFDAIVPAIASALSGKPGTPAP